ncbi:MAG: DinB family protein [Planctomycetales bacterium]|nr:DinB family protein [Planctomycetales bacterium]
MSIAIEGLLFGWKKNLDYGTKLVADLTDEQMVTQPAGVKGEAPVNHPAWLLSHLNLYLPVMAAIIEGRDFNDPKQHRFGMLSKPEADGDLYSSKDELVEAFVLGHEHVEAMLRNASDNVLEQPVLLPRWKEIMPKAGIALPYLMLNHENTHLGQLSAWRRMMGLPSV